MGPGRQLRLSVALQRITVTFSRIFDEASLIGEERRNVGRTQTKLAFTEDKNRATSCETAPGSDSEVIHSVVTCWSESTVLLESVHDLA